MPLSSSTAPVTIIGIDPGYDRIGWCIGTFTPGSGLSVVKFGSIETDKKASLVDRYQQIDQELQQLLDTYTPTEAAIETLFFSKNQKTAMQVSEARGVIISTLFRSEIKIAEYNPMQMKLAVTGYGKADKSAVDKMLRIQLKLGTQKILDDTMDAIGIAVTHAVSRRIML